MSSIKITSEIRKTIPWKLVLIFLCFSAAIIICGALFYNSQRIRIFHQNEDELTSIATLKVSQIEQWRGERLNYAEVIKDDAPLINRIKEYFTDENQPEIKTDLTKWMESVYKEYDFGGILFIDTTLKVRLSVSPSDMVAGEVITEELKHVMQNGTIVLTDLHGSINCVYVHADLLIPLIDRTSKSLKPFGVLIFRIDPEKRLFPLIQSWPIPSKSSETLLLRKDGDSVLYLNELRFRKNTALNLRLPITNSKLLASKAVSGQKGVCEGTDYRNIPAVGYLTDIPGSTWFLVTKIDKEEIKVPIRRYFILSIIIILLLTLINASVLVFWIWNQRVVSYRMQLLNERSIRESQEKLIESEELFRKLFKNMLDGFAYCKMLYVDGEPPDFLYINVNEAFELLTGLKNVEGKKVSEVIPGIQRADPELLEKYGRVALTGKPEVFETYVESLKMWFSISVYSPKKEHFVAVFDVITARKLSEEALHILNEELEQRVTQRTEQLLAANKELEAFSYSVSHDLRAPLRAINSYTNILIEEYENKLDEEGKRLCGIISSGAMQMGGLIDDLLSFSRIGRSTLNLSLIDMNKMVRTIIKEMLSPHETGKIKIHIGRLQKAHGDIPLFGQVWKNLLSNAIKYSSNNEKPEISIESEVNSNSITYHIKDNGVGFDMQYAHKLFGVFQRLHSESEFEGNGVGLAIVQRIILKHGGLVWAEGEVGKGAAFHFSLPVQN